MESSGEDTDIIELSDDEYCKNCSSMEAIIKETVIIWLDANAAAVLASIFSVKSPAKKRKLNK